MRRFAVWMCFLLLAATMAERGDSAPGPGSPTATIFDSNPAHLWNRLYAALLVRQDRYGTTFGEDSLDPPLWQFTKHLLEPDSHRRALAVLDEFLQTRGEGLIHDPVKRAILQRELWAVFDWSVLREPERPNEARYDDEKRELQSRLAEVLRRLALTHKEVEALPDNYAQAVASREFAKEYDPAHRDVTFLPADLFQENSSWVEVDRQSPEGEFDDLPAPEHVSAFSGRSRFLIFIRLPGGRKATLDYLGTLWGFSHPWVARTDQPQQTETNPSLPQFPVGTEVALVRQMTLFDSRGTLIAAPIMESVQIRVYRGPAQSGVVDESRLDEATAASGQDCYEIHLSLPRLFTGKSGGLRAVGRQESELFVFNAMGDDMLEDPSFRIDLKKIPPVVTECVGCHRGNNIQSVNSRANLVKPNWRQQGASYGFPLEENDATLRWKATHYDWGLLNGYWNARPQ